jgi:hypothetical protein
LISDLLLHEIVAWCANFFVQRNIRLGCERRPALWKVLKTRGPLPNDEAALKLLYLAIKNAKKTWGRGHRDWLTARSGLEEALQTLPMIGPKTVKLLLNQTGLQDVAKNDIWVTRFAERRQPRLAQSLTPHERLGTVAPHIARWSPP